MTLTRLKAETVLIGTDLNSGRAGRLLLDYRAYDPTTATLGSMVSLDAFLLAGLAGMGIEPADPDNLTDADFATIVTAADRARFLDYAELAAMQWVLSAMTSPDERTGTQTQNWGSFRKDFAASVASRREELELIYGLDGTLSGGVVDLNFDRGGSWGYE